MCLVLGLSRYFLKQMYAAFKKLMMLHYGLIINLDDIDQFQTSTIFIYNDAI